MSGQMPSKLRAGQREEIVGDDSEWFGGWSLVEPAVGRRRMTRILYCGAISSNSQFGSVIRVAERRQLAVDIVASPTDDRHAFRQLRKLLDRAWPLTDRFLGNPPVERVERLIGEDTGWLLIDHDWDHFDSCSVINSVLPIGFVGVGEAIVRLPARGAVIADEVELEKWITFSELSDEAYSKPETSKSSVCVSNRK